MTWCGHVLALLALTLTVVYSDEEVRYDGYHLLRVHPETAEHINALKNLSTDDEFQLDFWTEPSAPGRPVDILVSPDEVSSVQSRLTMSGVANEILMNDVQSLINEGQQQERVGFDFDGSSFDWQDYHTIDTMNLWLSEQAEKNKAIASVIVAGKTTEGRNITGLRIAHKADADLPVVFVEAGIHAREWITPATATWFIQEALSPSASDVIKSYEWHVFPSVNPDGYAYTRKNRLWRKTRSKNSFFCYGVDANRNWPFKWERSFAACGDTFPGSEPASEPETRAMVAYLDSVARRTRVYISLHSYSQLLMYPWGYTGEPPAAYPRLDEIARKAVEALKARHGTSYEFGPIASTIYPAAGCTIDYAYSLNITYPFVFELRDQGEYGFLLPKEQIIPTAQETFDALTVILREAKN